MKAIVNPDFIQCYDLELPDPPSANRYWRHGNGNTYVSAEAKDYKETVGWVCNASHCEPIIGPVAIVVHVWMAQLNGDVTNKMKVLEDALIGYVYEDDVQIVEQHVYRHEAAKPKRVNARVRVTVGSVVYEG